MNLTKFRTAVMSILGMKYRELPFGTRRADVLAVLEELNAQKLGESGTPAFEVYNEEFRIGKRRLRICTEDEMFVSLWGTAPLVDDAYARITAKSDARTDPNRQSGQ